MFVLKHPVWIEECMFVSILCKRNYAVLSWLFYWSLGCQLNYSMLFLIDTIYSSFSPFLAVDEEILFHVHTLSVYFMHSTILLHTYTFCIFLKCWWYISLYISRSYCRDKKQGKGRFCLPLLFLWAIHPWII